MDDLGETGGQAVFKKILVGTDGFGPASKAVARAAALAEDSGAELIVVHVARPPEAPPSSPLRDAASRPGADAGRGILQDVQKKYGERITIHPVMREGEPAEVLLDVAEEESVDLVVVGNRGMSKRFSLGVVPNQISHHAPCHVLIVRTGG